MKKSELKEIIRAEYLAEAKDSKKGNEDEQKRMEGAIRDDRDHIKNLKKDIEANESKLAKLKKDYKKDVVKENTINEEPVSAAVVAAGVAAIFGGSALLDKLMDKAEDGDFGKKGEDVAAFLRSAGSNAAGVTQQREEMKDDKDSMDEGLLDFLKKKEKEAPKSTGSSNEPIGVDYDGNYIYAKEGMSEAMRGDDMDEMMRGGSTYEEDDIKAEAEEVDVDVEDNIDIDDVSDESEIEVDSELAGEDADVSAILGLLTKAQANAKELGDEKLMDQIGNTITYYTRAHVVAEEMEDEEGMREEMDDKEDKEKVKKEELNEEFARFKKLAGLIK